jgi:membrane-associated phospholipid phosphatase
MKQEKLISKNYAFFLPFALFLAIGAILNIIYSQKTLFFWFNGSHFPWQDEIMQYYTNVGDGLFAVIIALLLLLFFSIRNGLITLISFLLGGIAVQILKRFVFFEHKRPWSMYASDEHLHLVAGYHPYSNNSFPSGHATSAFGLFVLLALFSKKKWMGLIYFLLAMMVAYSRVYLSQHFFIDIYFGALTGVVFSIITYLWLNGSKSFLKKERFDKGLLLIN